MNVKKHKIAYKATWGILLKIISIISTILLISLPIFSLFYQPDKGNIYLWYITMIVLPLSLIIIALPFIVLGYSVKGNKLLIHRLGWGNSFDLTNLTTATKQPKVMRRAIRIFGNGGLYSFTGKYREKNIGEYSAYITNFSNCIILEFSNNKKIAISPENGTKFLNKISQ